MDGGSVAHLGRSCLMRKIALRFFSFPSTDTTNCPAVGSKKGKMEVMFDALDFLR